jgi:chitinase
MKLRSWLTLLVLPAIILFTAGLTALPAAAQTNLLTNGGFATGNTSGWTCSSADSVVTSPTYDGAQYALAGTPTGSD